MHAGDRRAATEFVREWYPRVEGWVVRATSVDDIEDYNQAVFLHFAGAYRLDQDLHQSFDDCCAEPRK